MTPYLLLIDPMVLLKQILTCLAVFLLSLTASGYNRPDTVVVYEKEIVYDTLYLFDTVRVKKRMDPPAPARGCTPGIFPAVRSATLPEYDIILRESRNLSNEKSMNRMKTTCNLVCACLALLHQVTNVAAQETGTRNELREFPGQMSLVYPLGTHGRQSVEHCFNVSLNLLTGRVGAVNGLELGGWMNRTEQGVRGLQAAGILNMSGGQIVGVQTGGIGSIAGNARGLQAGGILALADTVKGVQIGGIFSTVDHLNGLQAAGVFTVSGNLKGLQIAGISNLSHAVKGLQAAGICNINGNLEGAQVAGILNVNDTVRGFTAGVINKTQVLRGVSFGLVTITDTIEKGGAVALVNIVKRGRYAAWELSFADYANVAVSYKTGGKGCYTIYTLGANFLEDRMWIAGIGLGHRSALSDRIDLNPELVSYSYFPEDFNVSGCTTFSTHLNLGVVYKVSPRLGISIAPSVYCLNADRTDKKEYRVSSFSSWHTSQSGNTKTKIGMGLSVGLNLW